ncbi:MAG TPA: hypothetical protein VG269_15965 [Tepidisphaeraceae bacterium]|jgi:hypothetical protein|nr:hypothetical protein [Tepidisphaeraceae bacterium]
MSADHPSNWLTPRRRLFAEKLVRYLEFHGCKAYLSKEKYADIYAETGLDGYAVDQAVEDLYRLGNIVSNYPADVEVITLLSSDLDEPTSAPPPTPTKPTITVAKTRNGGWRR